MVPMFTRLPRAAAAALLLLTANVAAASELETQQQALEAEIKQLNADIKAAGQAKDKTRLQSLREQRSAKQDALRELKQQARAADKASEQNQKRAAAEQTWATYPPAKQLCTAVEYNRLDLVKQVVESGRYTAAQSQQSSEGCFFPLGDAAARGHLEITAYLLQKGFPTSAKAPHFGSTLTVYDAAAGSTQDRTAILALLKQNNVPSTADETGSMAGARGMIAGADDFNREQLKEKHNVTDAAFSEGTALTKSLEDGHIANIRWLLGNGFTADSEMMGRTTLMIAIDSNEPEKVKAVLDAGADVNQRGVGYSSALRHAEKRLAKASKKNQTKMTEIVTLLKARGATYSDKERP